MSDWQLLAPKDYDDMRSKTEADIEADEGAIEDKQVSMCLWPCKHVRVLWRCWFACSYYLSSLVGNLEPFPSDQTTLLAGTKPIHAEKNILRN